MMLRWFAIPLMIIGLVSCSPQAENPSETSKPKVPGVEIGSIRVVRVLPENPRSGTPLTAEVLFRGRKTDRMSYQWLKNDNPIPGANTARLPGTQVRKGDFISVTARVSLPGITGDQLTSEAVIVGNTLPAAGWVRIDPKGPLSTDTLRAVASGQDPDGDDVIFSYQWRLNGEEIAGAGEPTLTNDLFRRGDRVQVVVTPFDGEEWGREVRSGVREIQNTPPKIVSKPPARTANGVFRYETQTEDADGDDLQFSLKGEPPDGMVIDSDTGVVEWQVVIPKGEVTYVFQVVAEDPEGGKSVQQITLKYGKGA